MSHSIIAELRKGGIGDWGLCLQGKAADIIEGMEAEIERLREVVRKQEEEIRKHKCLILHTHAVGERAFEMAQELSQWSAWVLSGGKP